MKALIYADALIDALNSQDLADWLSEQDEYTPASIVKHVLETLPEVDVIPVETVEKLCRKYVHDSRNVAKSNPTNLDKIALAIELCNRAEALGELLLMFGYDTLYREIHSVEVEK